MSEATATAQESVVKTTSFKPTHPPGTIIEGFNPKNLLFAGDDEVTSDARSKDKKVEELEASIKNRGWFGTILVEETPKGFKIVAGRRRAHAAINVGSKVRLEVIDSRVASSKALVMLVENEARQEDNAMNRSNKFVQFIDQWLSENPHNKRSDAIKILASELSVNANVIREHLSLQNLIPKAQKAIQDKKFPMSAVTYRGNKMTEMVEKGEDGEVVPNVEKQEKALAKLLGQGKVTRESAQEARENAEPSYPKVGKWEVNHLLESEEVPKEDKVLIAFLFSRASEQAVKRAKPWMRTAFAWKAGPGAGEVEE